VGLDRNGLEMVIITLETLKIIYFKVEAYSKIQLKIIGFLEPSKEETYHN
jgi:hypothetical protein